MAYTNRQNTIRAARKLLGSEAKADREFRVFEKDGAWDFEMSSAAYYLAPENGMEGEETYAERVARNATLEAEHARNDAIDALARAGIDGPADVSIPDFVKRGVERFAAETTEAIPTAKSARTRKEKAGPKTSRKVVKAKSAKAGGPTAGDRLVERLCSKDGATHDELKQLVGWAQCMPYALACAAKAGAKIAKVREGRNVRYFGSLT